METTMNSRTVYDIVTEQIVNQLKVGNIPWENTRSKPFVFAKNLVTKKSYRGMNLLLLNFEHNAASPFWASWNQIQEKKGKVKKGAKSQIVTFWKKTQYTSKNEAGEEETRDSAVLRFYRVFNLEDVEGIKDPLLDDESKETPIKKAEKLLKGIPNKCKVVRSSNIDAFYRPSEDKIVMPQQSNFTSKEQYYRTLFHELVHSTGHVSRLNRFNGDSAMNKESYSQEELVAEIGSAFLMAHCGLFDETKTKHAGYCQNWLKRLNNDHQLIVKAAGKAQKAVEYLLGESETENEAN
jgi:antirestriction protein ArdC